MNQLKELHKCFGINPNRLKLDWMQPKTSIFLRGDDGREDLLLVSEECGVLLPGQPVGTGAFAGSEGDAQPGAERVRVSSACASLAGFRIRADFRTSKSLPQRRVSACRVRFIAQTIQLLRVLNDSLVH